MPYDLVIKNGMVVDGTGFSRYRADVAIKDGTIVELGKIRGAAAATIDADGLVVAPGIIDLHTHYDAQPFWDKLCTSSVWHGVTTVLTGNCGLTLAPLRPEHREAMLATERGQHRRCVPSTVRRCWPRSVASRICPCGRSVPCCPGRGRASTSS